MSMVALRSPAWCFVFCLARFVLLAAARIGSAVVRGQLSGRVLEGFRCGAVRDATLTLWCFGLVGDLNPSNPLQTTLGWGE